MDNPQIQMWRLNTQLLIGIIACLGVGLVFLLIFWTVIRAWLFSRGQRNSERRYRAQRLDAAGKKLPPIARGLCNKCGAVGDVFYLESGEKLCKKCFAGQPKS